MFKELADIHTYGLGMAAIKVLYFDRLSGYSKESGSFAGYKFAIAAQGITKRELIDMAYKRIILNESVSFNGYSGHRVAITDAQRFRVPIVFSTKVFKFSQEDYEKTSWDEMHNKRVERERIAAMSDNLDLPF